MRVTDIADVIAPGAHQDVVGIRPGEKLHEQMIGVEDAPFTFEYSEYFKILPSINDWSSSEERIKEGRRVDPGFVYSSESNGKWMSCAELSQWINANADKLGGQ